MSAPDPPANLTLEKGERSLDMDFLLSHHNTPVLISYDIACAYRRNRGVAAAAANEALAAGGDNRSASNGHGPSGPSSGTT
ncbi:hypothetical protein C8F04DRAFT_1258046 [Mycena alexandri]|uniref:Uncharacterized protein n=1 Tax=Mycena alexandri TaxID=1745969 RepID=A0AAD6SYN8_9AGAR|nr:hypothetical protein C8F04DRAFT_1258046 [Mycena alexandri]